MNNPYKTAYNILAIALNGEVDSQDASDIAKLVIEGTEINWDNYSVSTKEALAPVFKEVS